jgi:anaerobic magnesium-protoporphyrin IX monomethyl ester cyclase
MRFLRAVIINPPNPVGYMSNKDSMGGFGQLYPAGAPPFPPLDLAYLAGCLSDKGYSVVAIDCAASNLDVDALLQRIGDFSPTGDCLFLVRTSLPTIDWDLSVCAGLANLPQHGGIGLFGPVIPSLINRVERDRTVAFALMTEADRPAAELMKGTEPEQIAGIAYRKGDAWLHTPALPFERDLDSLPFPKWDLLPFEKYVIPKSSTSGRARFLPMLSSRGCPFGCSYCPYPVGQGLKWRYRSPPNVVDEMELLVGRFGVEYILFRDPMFSAMQKRVVAICEEILARGLRVRWKCETRMDCLDESTIAIMARAGCVGINFGVESTDPDVQKGVHRTPILPAEFTEKVAMCRRHGIATFAFFVIGLPGDTRETILASIEFAVQIRANWTQFTVATPFIGTPMYDWALRERLIEPDFYKILNAHDESVGNENLSGADIKRMHSFAQFLQNHLINRHGILKNENRTSIGYRALKALADLTSNFVALMVFRAGRWHFRRTIPHVPSGNRRMLPRSEPVVASRP